MAKLYSTINKVADTRQVGIVLVDLLWDGDDSPAALDSVNKETINGPVKISTDNDGNWELDGLVPNADIIPTDNVYLIKEYSDDEEIEYYVTIPGDSDYWLGDVITTKPTWIKDDS